ncbi:MAG: hypothetical protein AAF984_10630 [Verrucomicrobiota bacterium]
MKWFKLLLAILLLPFLAASVVFGWHTLMLVWDAWNWMDLACFFLGFSLWLTLFFGLPRPTWLYVFGHEATHALAILFSGGKIKDFKVSSEGGHVVSNKMSAWIALSPYIIPFYPSIIGLAWILLRSVWPVVDDYYWAFLLIWGISWGFHVSFTLYVMGMEQTDFTSQGYFFSLVIILGCNLWILVLFLWWWAKPMAWKEGGQLLFSLLSGYYMKVFYVIKDFVVWISDKLG